MKDSYSEGKLPHKVVMGFLVVLLLIVPVNQGEMLKVNAATEEDYTYTNGEITGYSGPGGDITIPETLGGEKVTSIGDKAFKEKGLTSVVIPEGITEIGTASFEDNNLSNVIFPSSLRILGNYAFKKNNLTNVTIPEGITRINYAVFDYNNLKHVVIPDVITYIDYYAFAHNNLLSISIPKGVLVIEPFVFNDNPNLVIIGERDSRAYNYARDKGIRFLTFDDPLEFEFEPNGSGDKWEQDVFTTVNVYGFGNLDLQYRWTTDKDNPDINDGKWVSFDNGQEIVTDKEAEQYLHIYTKDENGTEKYNTSKVFLIDHTPPELILEGDKTINIAYGDKFVDPGYEVTDELDENIEDNVEIDGKVNTNEIGSYEITYTAIDHAGNETIVTRTVNVIDEESPVITLKGDNPLELEAGTPLKDPHATSVDNVDGDISDKIMVTGEVNINKLGIYHLYYNVSDSSGNKAIEVVREVHVVAPDVISIGLDNTPVPVYAGSTVKIENTQTRLELPNDLPVGTTLQINSVGNPSINGYEVIGEIYDFNLMLPEGYENYEGEFILTLGIHKNKEETAIYYYNENSKKLEYIGGKIKDGKIKGSIDHFSIYGVFAPQVKENGSIEETIMKSGKRLPKTATNNSNMLGIGFGLVLIGGIAYVFIRRRAL